MESISVSNNSNPIPILKKTKRRPSSLHRTRLESLEIHGNPNQPSTHFPSTPNRRHLPSRKIPGTNRTKRKIPPERRICRGCTWRVSSRVQGDRRHAGVPRDRVLMRMMLVVRMREGVRLLVRGVIGVERFVACHQRVQHVEHHLRGCSGAATRRLTE